VLKLAFGALVIVAALFGPVFLETIEQNVELFFLLIGLLTAAVMGQFNLPMVGDALSEPLPFTLAVLAFGAGFRVLKSYFDELLRGVIEGLDPRLLCFCLAIILGFLAAVITPVISALIFVEAISVLHCDRSSEIAATVFACFAIGLGAGLTPLGMPGIAVVLRAIHADFWYLARLLWLFVAVGIILTAVPTLFLPFTSGDALDVAANEDSWGLVLLVRPGKVFVFIAGLVALSDGLRPSIDSYIHHLPTSFLFWMNTISAVVNNSTMAVLEIGPTLSIDKQRAALLGLLISGGALVPGNIPNIVAASRLGITSREWAKIGLGTAVALLILCFVVLRTSFR
jgi:predicted cation transporter